MTPWLTSGTIALVMLLTPHVLAGLLVGSISPNPVIAFAGGVASHLLLDALPHLDSRSFRDKSTRNEVWLSDLIIGGIDGIVCIAIFVYLVTHGASPTVLAGAIGGVFPDLIKAPCYGYFRNHHTWLSFLTHWHRRAHFDTSKFKRNRAWIHAGAWSQILLVLLALVYFQRSPITKGQTETLSAAPAIIEEASAHTKSSDDKP